jgi:Tol biopolymer transport system component
LAISGTLLSLEGYLPIVTLKPNGADFKQVVDETNRGDFAVLTPDGRVFYMLFSSGTESRLLRYVNFNGSQGRLVQDAWGGQPSIFFQRMPTISGDGRYLAFAGKNVLGNERYSAVYVLDLTRFLNLTPLPTRTQGATPTRTLTATQKPDITPPPTETKSPPGTATATASAIPLNASLMRVTPKDIGENDWPAISPDGRFVVFVTDAAAVGKSGTDLYISSVEPDAPSRQLTTDGDALFESAPEFSPDGKQIAFNVTIEKAPEKQRNAIVIMNVDGSGRQTLVQTENDNNIRPQWSPDGKYIAFSSNRTGKMEIFIIEIATKKLYQVTSLRDPVIITDWGN